MLKKDSDFVAASDRHTVNMMKSRLQYKGDLTPFTVAQGIAPGEKHLWFVWIREGKREFRHRYAEGYPNPAEAQHMAWRLYKRFIKNKKRFMGMIDRGGKI